MRAHGRRNPGLDVADQLSSDLASLKIDRSAAQARQRAGGNRSRVVVVVAFVFGLGVLGYVFAAPALKASVFKTEVALTEISLQSPAQASVELTSSGYVVPQLVTRVGAKLPGRVASVHVRQGDPVKAGALLVELEGADRQAALQEARMRAAAAVARVATARANWVETRNQALRQRQLAKQGVAPAATAEDLEARAAALSEAVGAAEAEVKAAQAQVESERVSLQYLQLVAPIAGKVVNKPPEVGELMGMEIRGVSESVIELADFSTLMVETDIPESRMQLAKLGAPCEIALDAFPGTRFRGEAVEIKPRVDRAKATVGVKVRFVDANDGVLPDMSARVSFLSRALDASALAAKPRRVVPAAALAERGGSKVVFVLEGERARMRPVRLGEPLRAGFELLEGPEPGTRVISNPPPELGDGQGVKQKDRG